MAANHGYVVSDSPWKRFRIDSVFARQVEALGKAGDILVGSSTSGNSKNVLLAFEAARRIGN